MELERPTESLNPPVSLPNLLDARATLAPQLLVPPLDVSLIAPRQGKEPLKIMLVEAAPFVDSPNAGANVGRLPHMIHLLNILEMVPSTPLSIALVVPRLSMPKPAPWHPKHAQMVIVLVPTVLEPQSLLILVVITPVSVPPVLAPMLPSITHLGIMPVPVVPLFREVVPVALLVVSVRLLPLTLPIVLPCTKIESGIALPDTLGGMAALLEAALGVAPVSVLVVPPLSRHPIRKNAFVVMVRVRTTISTEIRIPPFPLGAPLVPGLVVVLLETLTLMESLLEVPLLTSLTSLLVVLSTKSLLPLLGLWQSPSITVESLFVMVTYTHE